MISTAQKYSLTFTSLAISDEIKLKMPIWRHVSMNMDRFQLIQRKDAVKCLRENHQVRNVGDIVSIAHRRTSPLNRRPHRLNESGISRKNCGCVACQRDRNELGCKHPGKCIAAAEILLDAIYPKWNPTCENRDLCNELALTDEEREQNGQAQNDIVTFDPDFMLRDLSHGFRIFASDTDNVMNKICAKRYRAPSPDPPKLTIFLHAHILHPGEQDAEMKILILDKFQTKFNVALNPSFTTIEPLVSFSTALLAGLLWVIQNVNKNTEILICSSTDYLAKAFVIDRTIHENNMLDKDFQLWRAVLAALNERCGRVQFKKVTPNPATALKFQPGNPVVLDTDIDIMFNCPGVMLSNGTQRFFTKVINSLKAPPLRKSTESNLDRIRCCIQEVSGYSPTNKAIWTSLRSRDIQRITRNFLWKCVHNIFRIGHFWNHIENLEILGQCPSCNADETLEHIMLECDAPGQHQVWELCAKLWRYKYGLWPQLNWGLLLGCNLVRFKSTTGKLMPSKQRLFAILVSTSMHLIWRLRNERRIDRSSGEHHTHTEIHNRWVAAIDLMLKRDRLFTSKIHFGRLAFRRQMVLNTWSGILWEEDSLPDDWIQSDRVLVGIRPQYSKRGIG